MPRPPHLKTTLSLPMDLAESLKVIATESCETVNAIIVRALKIYVSARKAAGGIEERGADLGEQLARLATRVEALEVGSIDAEALPAAAERRLLDAPGVRREARAIIRRLGRPVPHGELKYLLEQRFEIPGRRPTENLRTILVHPKAPKGFVLLAKQGYIIDDRVE